jgi:hypothetical protein
MGHIAGDYRVRRDAPFEANGDADRPGVHVMDGRPGQRLRPECLAASDLI